MEWPLEALFHPAHNPSASLLSFVVSLCKIILAGETEAGGKIIRLYSLHPARSSPSRHVAGTQDGARLTGTKLSLCSYQFCAIPVLAKGLVFSLIMSSGP